MSDEKPAIVGKPILNTAKIKQPHEFLGTHTPLGLCNECVAAWKSAEAAGFGGGVPPLRAAITLVLTTQQIGQIMVGGMKGICSEHIIVQKTSSLLQAQGGIPPSNGHGG